MRLNQISHDVDGKCVGISYLGAKDDIHGHLEHFGARLHSRRKRVHIGGLGGEFTFAQVRVIAETLLEIVEDNE